MLPSLGVSALPFRACSRGRIGYRDQSEECSPVPVGQPASWSSRAVRWEVPAWAVRVGLSPRCRCQSERCRADGLVPASNPVRGTSARRISLIRSVGSTPVVAARFAGRYRPWPFPASIGRRGERERHEHHGRGCKGLAHNCSSIGKKFNDGETVPSMVVAGRAKGTPGPAMRLLWQESWQPVPPADPATFWRAAVVFDDVPFGTGQAAGITRTPKCPHTCLLAGAGALW